MGKFVVIRKKVLVVLLLFFVPVAGQDFYPPFPRTVYQSPAGTAGGAIDFFYSLYDLAIHGLTGSEAAALNDSIRLLNPNSVILGTSRQGPFASNSIEGQYPELFAYLPVRFKLIDEVGPGTSSMRVERLNSYPAPDPATAGITRYALIDGRDWISFAVQNDTTISGIPTSGSMAIEMVHQPDKEIVFPIRFVGFGMLPNYTEYAPLIGGTTETWRWFIDHRFTQQDFSHYDGVFYDAYRTYLYGTEDLPQGVDFDMNGVDDFEEHGLAWINAKWAAGISLMLDYEHVKFSEINPGKLALIAINSGAAENSYVMDHCEGMLWEGFRRFQTDYASTFQVNRSWELHQRAANEPNLVMIIDYVPEAHYSYGKDNYYKMRYGLTLATITGAYYGRTFGDYYYLTFYYDEFDADLGYPTSEPYLLPSGAHARFFDNGAVICNGTGNPITVSSSELVGLAGYDGPYYRFRGGQDPVFNNGQLFESVYLHGETRIPIKYNWGDGILLFKEDTTIVADIIIGNTFNGDTSPGQVPVVLEGNWNSVPGQGDYTELPFSQRMPHWSQWNRDIVSDGVVVEPNVVYAYAEAGDGSSIARITPRIGVPGYYELAEWHGWWSNTTGNSLAAAPNAQFKAFVDGQFKMAGSYSQQHSLGQWNPFAVLWLPAGQNSWLQVSNNADGYVIVDGFRFRYLGDDLPADTTPPRNAESPQILRQP